MNSTEIPRAAQVGQQVEDLGADADVEHRDRLVGQQDRGLEHQRAGDHHALALAARELVRPAAGEGLGRLQPGVLQRAAHARGPLGLAAREPVHHQRLGDDLVDGHVRVQRLIGVLENHLDVPAQLLQLGAAGVHDAASLERDLARGRLLQAHQRQHQRRLAAAALADQRQHLAAPQLEAHVVDRVDIRVAAAPDAALAGREQLAQVADGEDWCVGHR